MQFRFAAAQRDQRLSFGPAFNHVLANADAATGCGLASGFVSGPICVREDA